MIHYTDVGCDVV